MVGRTTREKEQKPVDGNALCSVVVGRDVGKPVGEADRIAEGKGVCVAGLKDDRRAERMEVGMTVGRHGGSVEGADVGTAVCKVRAGDIKDAGRVAAAIDDGSTGGKDAGKVVDEDVESAVGTTVDNGG